MMALNGVRVPGHNMTVRANFRLDEKELSGQSSATDTAETGIKPQTLSVSLTLGHQEVKDLSILIALARAVDDSGQRTLYTITNLTAKAGNIRKVRFTDNFTWAENDGTKSWQVNFTLKEHQSVPEKIEQRQETPAVMEPSAESETESTIAPETAAEPVTSFKAVLKKLDDALA